MEISSIIPGTDFNCHFSDHLEPPAETAFKAFVDGSPSGSSMQRPAWRDLVHLSRVRKFAYLRCEDKDSGRIIMAGVARLTQLLPKRYIAVFHRGPVFRETAHLDMLLPGVMACLRKAGVSTMTVSPRWEDEGAAEVRQVLETHGFTKLGFDDQSLHTATGLIDLTRSEEDIFSSFSKRCRGDIRRTARKGIVIQSIATEKNARAFRDVYREMAVRRGMEIAGQPDIVHQWQSFEKGREQGVCLGAEIDGRIVGGVIVVREGERAMIRTLASLPVSLKLPRSHGLMWEAIRHMKQLGCHVFDMGGVEAGNGYDGRQRRYLFKLAFNPKIVNLVPIHMAVLRPSSHKLMFGIRRVYRRFPIRHYVTSVMASKD